MTAILKKFNTFEVIAMPAAHGQKDIDDFILSLIRDPAFPRAVNDIVVECGNARLQPLLDRYIAGEDVPFTAVQHVWRDTTVQQMCGASGFYEQLYPLVRAINQHLQPASRLRVVAADPPIDWEKIRSYQDLTPFFDRDGHIASVMESEVLTKHRKALILFGVFHLIHAGGPGEGDAVTRYERKYPGRTYVITDLGYYDPGGLPHENAIAHLGTSPALLETKHSRLGSLRLDSFFETPLTTDSACNVTDAFAGTSAKRVTNQTVADQTAAKQTVADLIDAFLYLGPQRTLLSEPLPADIALDHVYRAEWLRRMKLVGLPGPATLEEMDAQTVADAADPVLFPASKPSPSQRAETKMRVRQGCLSQREPGGSAAK